MKPGDIVGDEWRWPVIALGVACSSVIIAIWVVKRSRRRLSFAESMALWGGAGVCACATLSTAGVLFDWDPVWRLPPMAAALAYVLIGRGIELRQLIRRGSDQRGPSVSRIHLARWWRFRQELR